MNMTQDTTQSETISASRGGGPSGGPRVWLQAVGAALTSWMVSIFFAAPSFHHLNLEWIRSTRAGDYLLLCADPMTRDLKEVFLAYRPFPTMLTHLLGAREWLALALPYLATVAMLMIVFVALFRRSGPILAWTGTLLVGTTSAVTWPNCMVGYPDSFAHLFAAVLLLNPSRAALFVCCTCGVLTDERFVLALPFVWLWHGGFRRDAATNRADIVAVGAALALCLLVRHGLKVGWIGPGIPDSKTYDGFLPSLMSLRPFEQTWAMWVWNVFGGFRWASFLLAAAAVIAWRGGEKLAATVFAGGLALTAAGSLLVFDVTRTMGFACPALVVAMSWLSKGLGEAACFKFSRWTVLLCLITPTYWIASGFFFWWWRPLPLRAIFYLTGEDPVRWPLW